MAQIGPGNGWMETAVSLGETLMHIASRVRRYKATITWRWAPSWRSFT
ncbi:MAG: hypothetical protein R3E31_02090 [Chloroflexota bacterium]